MKQKEEAKKLDERSTQHDQQFKDILTSDPLYLKYLQRQDPFIFNLYQNLASNSDDEICRNYSLLNDIVYKNFKGKQLVVVPQDCRKLVLLEFHDRRGHRATKSLIKNILEYVWWPSISKDCQVYVKSCHYCMLHKENIHDRPGFLKPTIAKRPFSKIACDFVGKLPLTKKKNQHFCIIVDYYTKYMWTKAVPDADTNNAIECLFSYTMQFGVCEEYTSDSASYFTSFAFQQILDKWDIFHNAFRKIPHCNGQVERSVQTLKNILAQLLLEFGDEWDQYLEIATFMYNINHHDTIQCSPFFAVHGFNPLVPGLLQLLPSNNEILQEKLQKHTNFLKDLRVRISKAQARTKRQYDKNRREVSYKVGQSVRIRNEADELAWPQKKVLWRGPYKIVGKKSDRFYFVSINKRTNSGKKKQIVKEYHVKNIRPYTKRPKDLRVRSEVSGLANISFGDQKEKYFVPHIIHKDGNVLNAPYYYRIAHCISADVRVGAGLAKTIQKYFGIREALRKRPCEVGTAEFIRVSGRGIYNLVTKEKYDHKPDFIDLKYALRDVRRQMIRHIQQYLAVLKLEAGLDKIQLSKVIALIFEVFPDTSITIQMYDYRAVDTWDDMITSFSGDHKFLSNFYECPIEIEGQNFRSAEHAYHSRKFTDSAIKQVLETLKPEDIHKVVCKWSPCSDWENIRDDWMVRCVHEKFKQNPRLRHKLLRTGNRFLLYQNYYHQQFWGTCACADHRKIPGENELGWILMRERDQD